MAVGFMYFPFCLSFFRKGKIISMVCSCCFLSCDELLAVPLCWHVVDAMHPFNNFLRLVCLRVQMTDSEMSTWRNRVSAGHVVAELGINHV